MNVKGQGVATSVRAAFALAAATILLTLMVGVACAYAAGMTTVDAAGNSVTEGPFARPIAGDSAFVLIIIPGTVHGTVTDSGTGKPIQGVTVRLYAAPFGPSYVATATASTDASGSYDFSASPGTYRVDFYDPYGRYASEAYHNQTFVFTGTEFAVSSLATTTVNESLQRGLSVVLKVTTEATGGYVPDGTGTNLNDVDANTYSNAYLSAGRATYIGRWPGHAYRGHTLSSAQFEKVVWRQPSGSPTFTGSPGTTVTVGIKARHNPTYMRDAIRKAGSNRWSSSVWNAMEGHEDWSYVTDVVIASGADAGIADALSASGLAGAYNDPDGAPLLLVNGSVLPAEVKSALQAMPNGIDVHIVGGPATVSDGVKNAIDALPNVSSVERIWGANRYSTAAQVAVAIRTERLAQGKPAPSVALYANGQDPAKFFDALALSPVAWQLHAPILLVGKDYAPQITTYTAQALGLTTRYCAGGTGTISEATRVKLGVPPANRWWGADRYATAVAVANGAEGLGMTRRNIGVAATIPDALSGGAAMGQLGGPILLTKTTGVPTVTQTYATGHMPASGHWFVFGGTASMPESQRIYFQNSANP